MTDGNPQTPKGHKKSIPHLPKWLKKTFRGPQSRPTSHQSPASTAEGVQFPNSYRSGSSEPLPVFSSVIQDQHNTENQDGATSASSHQVTGTAHGEIADLETLAGPALSTAKDIAGVAWGFTEMLLKKLPSVVETNPLKLATGLIKIVLEIKDAVKGNIDAVALRILSTAEQLELLEKALEGWKPDKVEETQCMKLYQTTLHNEWINLIELKNQSIIRKIAAHEQDKEKIADIFERINRAREQLVLVTGLRVHRIVSRIEDKVTKLRLEQLKPSHIADHKFELMGEQRRLLRRAVCTPGTRIRILDDIVKWANDTSPESQTVYWLSGQVGSGKTTIAYTIARRFEFAGDSDDTITLGGNFFCSRQIEEARSAICIIRTIAYHLSLKYAPFAEALIAFGKFDTINHGVRAQLESLLIEPWKQAQLGRSSNPPRFLIVIDALDEIEGTGGSEFLRDLLDVINKYRLPGLKFLATSRPDPNLVMHLSSFEDKQVYRLEQVSTVEAHMDITTYLNAYLPAFVGSPDMEMLVIQAAGLFIFAATIVRYLEDYQPFEQKERLDALPLASNSISSETSEEETPLLDALYMEILTGAFRHFKDKRAFERRLQILFTFLCSAERTSTSVVAELLFPSNNSDNDPAWSLTRVADDVLARLHAVLYQENGIIFSYHKSFIDFLFNRSRAKEFACDEAKHHQMLTDSCFCVMGRLKFNICNIESSFVLDRDNPSLPQAVTQNIPPVLSYSCRNWDYHLLAVQSSNSNPYYGILSKFLQLPVLFWLEAMNLLGSRGQCTEMLWKAEQWVQDDNVLLKKELAEVASFALYFSGSGAALSTPHLYLSALATWPRDLEPCYQWKKHFPAIPNFRNAFANDQPLMSLEARSEVFAVGFSADGKHIVSGSFDGIVRIWDASTGQMLKMLRGHTKSIESVVFSSNSKFIISGSRDNSVRVWDVCTGQMLEILKGHTDEVCSVAFSNDGKHIVSGSLDKSLRLWDISNGYKARVLEGHSGPVGPVAFSSDSKYIVSGSLDKSVKIWDVLKGQMLKTLKGHSSQVYSAAFSRDGLYIISGSEDTSIIIWDASSGNILRILKGHTLDVYSVAFSSDSKFIVSGSFDNSIRIWHAATGQTLKVLEGHTGWVYSVAFSSNDKYILSGSFDKSVRLWDAAPDALLGNNFKLVSNTLESMIGTFSSIAFSSDGKHIVCGFYDKSMQILDSIFTTTTLMPRVLRGHTSWTNSVAFSSDSKCIVSGSQDKSIKIWNVSTGQMLKTLNGHTGRVCSVAFSSDGVYIVSGSQDKSVRIWNASKGIVLKMLEGHTAAVNCVEFSSDGKYIVSGSRDKTVCVWDVSIGQMLKMLRGHNDIVYSVAFSKNSKHIVSGSEDRSVRIWDVSTGQMLQVLEDHTLPVYSVAFSNDDKHIVSGSGDGIVRMWDTFTGQMLQILEGHTGHILSAVFSSDGMHILSGSKDQTVRCWNLSLEQSYFYYVREKIIDTSGNYQHTGWLLSPNKHYLMFVPPAANLPDVHNIQTFPSSRIPYLDFTSSTLGHEWSKCFSLQ